MLSPETVRKAREELREDEDKKEHSLKQFKEWLKLHPFIKRCCIDDVFLLSFLRAKKYWNDQAFKVLENYLIFRYRNPQWFDLSDEKVEKYRQITRDGYIYNCEERNHDKSSYMICNFSQANFEKFTVEEMFHCYFINSTLLVLDERAQVGGASGVANMTNASLKQIAIYPIGQVVSFSKYLVNAHPLRIASISIVGASSYANQIINVFKMALSEKLKHRVHAMSDFEELRKRIDKKTLPTKMGGRDLSEAEIIELHLRNFEEKLPLLRRVADFELIEANIDEALRAESVGSFRKLNID